MSSPGGKSPHLYSDVIAKKLSASRYEREVPEAINDRARAAAGAWGWAGAGGFKGLMVEDRGRPGPEGRCKGRRKNLVDVAKSVKIEVRRRPSPVDAPQVAVPEARPKDSTKDKAQAGRVRVGLTSVLPGQRPAALRRL